LICGELSLFLEFVTAPWAAFNGCMTVSAGLVPYNRMWWYPAGAALGFGRVTPMFSVTWVLALALHL